MSEYEFSSIEAEVETTYYCRSRSTLYRRDPEGNWSFRIVIGRWSDFVDQEGLEASFQKAQQEIQQGTWKPKDPWDY